EAEQRYKTFESKLQMLKNRVYEAGIVIGNAILPPLLDIVNFVGPILTDLAGWFGNLPGPIKAVALGLGMVLALAGPMLMFIGAIASGMGALSGALSFIAAHPVVLVIAGIVALVAGLVVAYHKVGWFRSFVDASFKIVKTVVVAVVNGIIAVFKFLWGVAKSVWKGIRVAAKVAFTAIKL